MPKEYRTIQEVAGPLMMVKGVEGVAYDELGEIELANGEKRRCKVLEVDGDNLVVQLYENAAGINLKKRYQWSAYEPGGPCISFRVHPDRCVSHRRTEHPGTWTEAADLLLFRSATFTAGGPDRKTGKGTRQR